MRGMIANNGVLWLAARQARDRTREVFENDPDACPVDPLVAIILSALTAEAFINELAECVAMLRDHPHPAINKISPELRAFAVALEEVEAERGSVNKKYLIAAQTLSGKSFDKGANPYQDFSILVSLRNDLVHMKPRGDTFVPSADSLEIRHANHIKALQQKGLAITPPKGSTISWVTAIQTVAMADWAYETARQMILAILAMIPDGGSSAFDPLSFEKRTYRHES